VLGSLIAYMIVYLLMYPAGIAVMARIVRNGPMATDAPIPIVRTVIAATKPGE